MGRRRVRSAAPPSDGAVGSAAGILSASSTSTSTDDPAGRTNTDTASNGQPFAAAARGAAAAAVGKKDGKNPLMGLLHYGSDSDDDETPAGSHSSKLNDTSSALAAHQGGAAAAAAALSSSDPAAGQRAVTYLLPAGWQQCMDNAGLVYFWNTATGETAWDPPVGTETRRSPATPPAAAAAIAAPAHALSEGSTLYGASVHPSKDTTDAGEEAQAGSDGTSDTASEAEEDRDRVGETGVSRDNAGEPGSKVPATPTDEGKAPRRFRRSAVVERLARKGKDEDGGATAKKGGAHGQGKGETPPQQGTTEADANAEAPGGTAAGVDDLLAGIEAELLSGGDGGGAADSRDETSSEGGEGEEEDFSPLRLVEPGLDKRAREANSDLTASLAAEAAGAKKDGGAGAGGTSGDGGVGRLGIELAAVLHARLSDWREGADGEVIYGVGNSFVEQKAFFPGRSGSSQPLAAACPFVFFCV